MNTVNGSTTLGRVSKFKTERDQFAYDLAVQAITSRECVSTLVNSHYDVAQLFNTGDIYDDNEVMTSQFDLAKCIDAFVNYLTRQFRVVSHTPGRSICEIYTQSSPVMLCQEGNTLWIEW